MDEATHNRARKIIAEHPNSVLITIGEAGQPVDRVMWTAGYVTVEFGYIKRNKAFEAESARRELLDRLNSIPSIDLPPDSTERFPSIKLAVLRDTSALDALLECLDWMLDKIRLDFQTETGYDTDASP